MSNHIHLVVQLKPKEAERWTADEVLERWCSLFRGAPLVQKYRAGEELRPAERDAVEIVFLKVPVLHYFLPSSNGQYLKPSS